MQIFGTNTLLLKKIQIMLRDSKHPKHNSAGMLEAKNRLLECDPVVFRYLISDFESLGIILEQLEEQTRKVNITRAAIAKKVTKALKNEEEKLRLEIKQKRKEEGKN